MADSEQGQTGDQGVEALQAKLDAIDGVLARMKSRTAESKQPKMKDLEELGAHVNGFMMMAAPTSFGSLCRRGD